jgi:hypothetical protein
MCVFVGNFWVVSFSLGGLFDEPHCIFGVASFLFSSEVFVMGPLRF